jgi:hypothetical protein
MKDPEDIELRRVLRRVDAPEGFADRVLTRVAQSGLAAPQQPKVAKTGWAIAATLAIVAGGGGAWYRAAEQRRVQGEEAKRQVLLSLTIAGSKLKAIEMKVNRGGER